jgi:hypothetical protein
VGREPVMMQTFDIISEEGAQDAARILLVNRMLNSESALAVKRNS